MSLVPLTGAWETESVTWLQCKKTMLGGRLWKLRSSTALAERVRALSGYLWGSPAMEVPFVHIIKTLFLASTSSARSEQSLTVTHGEV